MAALTKGLFISLALASAAMLGAQETAPPAPAAPVLVIPAAAQAGPAFQVDAATRAWLDTIPPQAKARSDAYFEGGYWLILWDFLYGAAVAILLLATGWSARMRDFAERLSRFSPVRTFLYWCQYVLATAVLGAPLALYEGFFRERAYGLATQTLGAWLGDQAKGLLLSLLLGGLVVTALFGVVRRLRRSWWIWGSLVTLAFLVVAMMIGPVYLVPIFNKVTPIQDARVTGPILSLARANGIPARDVYQIDASRQTTRISANVSGLGSTMRITLNDNLLRRGAPEEIQAVMGHEMGHYVLNHVYKMLLQFLVIVVASFAFLSWALGKALARWGARWRIRDIGDAAVLPLVILVFSVIGLVLTPVMNNQTRTAEAEADIFGLNAARQPDGFAQAAVHLSDYRKMHPGPVEEWLFFDHPSGYSRIHMAMTWKAENQGR